jgi:tRNA(fMet)-specific endonuclease VapC
MRRFLLDTGIAAHYMNRRQGVHLRAKAEMAKGHKVGICIPVLAELCFGAENSNSRDATLRQISRALRTWKLWPATPHSAREYGRLAAHLKRVGRPMQQLDIFIAAIALEIPNCTLVSADSDLLAIPGLTVENWNHS